MSINKVENGRAAYAFNKVENTLKSLSDKKQKEYRSYIKKMPMMIKVNGLGQTLAFYFSKRDDAAYKCIYEQLAEWITCHYSSELNLSDEARNKEFISIIVEELSSQEYRMVTFEIINMLNWMRRFVDGLLKDRGDNNNARNILSS